MKFADIIFKKVNRFMEIFLVLIFGLLVLDVLWQVFSRYVLNTSFSWTEELARFSLIWLSILGAAYLNARREHLSMEILIFLFALIVMVIGGLNLVYITLHLDQLSGTLRIPLGYIYAIMPFSGFLILCFCVYHILKISKNQITV